MKSQKNIDNIVTSMPSANSDDGYPTFQLNRPRFDQSTFYGRWRHFMDVIDPRTLFVSKEKLAECVSLLDKYKTGDLPPGTKDKDLWEAQKIKQAIIHPDTGQKVFMPFRMSGFVPFGSPIVVGLLLPNQTTATTIFWQWINQSHNACVNYANRNATKPTPPSRFIAGYVGAVTTAVSIAVGLNVLIKRANSFSPTTKLLVQRFVPFPAVAAASTFNVLLMRNNELSTGIQVVDRNDNVIGSSKIAARKALQETAMTRIFLPAPILIIPPALMAMLEKTKFLKTNPRLHLPINAFLVTACFGLALPVAIALFPQYSKISTDKLEPELRSLTSEKDLYYNKGL